MPTPDNRIKLPSTRIDFTNDVGVTGQDHDEYPSPGQQARFDHLRMYLIGLLSNQSSYLTPTNYREGTLWFDLNEMSLKIYSGDSWKNISDAVNLGDESLQEFYARANPILTSASPEIVYKGIVNTTGIDYLTIPSSVSSYVYSDTRAFVIINGDQDKTKIILSPQDVSIEGTPAALIRLNTVTLEQNDSFLVSLRRVPGETFISTPVIVN